MLKRMGIFSRIKDIFSRDKKEDKKTSTTPYEGSQLQKDVSSSLPQAKDVKYQESQLKKDVEAGPRKSATRGGGGGGGSRDASYTSGGTTYNPATKSLDEVNKPPQNKLTRDVGQSTKKRYSTTESYVSPYEAPSGNALTTLGGSSKAFARDMGRNIQIAFMGGSGDYVNPFRSFGYASPVVKDQTNYVYGGDMDTFAPTKSTITNAYYGEEFNYERKGTGAFIEKYGETGAIVGGSIVAPSATSFYLITSGQVKFIEGKNTEGLIRTGIGSVPLAIQLRNIAKPMGDITKIRYEELDKAKVNIIGSQTKGDYNLIARQTAYGGERTTLLNLKSSQTGTKVFEFGGRGYSQTIVQDYWTGKPITSMTKLIASGRGTQAGWFVQSPNAIATIPEIQAGYGIGMSGERTITNFLGKATQQQPSINLFGWGGFSKPSDVITSIASGQISKGGGGLTLSTSARGFIINTADDVGTSIGSSSGTPTTTFKNIFPTGAIEQITKTTTPSFSSASNIPRTTFSTSSLTETQDFKPFTTTQPITIDTTKTRSTQIPKIDTQQIQKGLTKEQEKTIQVSVPSFKSVSDTKVNQLPRIIQPVKELEKQTTKQITAQGISTIPAIPTPSITTPFVPKIPLIIPWLPNLDFSSKRTTRIFRGKQRKKYTPSFEALTFNIKGKMPKGVETGFRLRPIPKNYSFAFSQGFNFNPKKFKFKVPKIKL